MSSLQALLCYLSVVNYVYGAFSKIFFLLAEFKVGFLCGFPSYLASFVGEAYFNLNKIT